MTRKCSSCGNNGHNSRTCSVQRGLNNCGVGGGLRLFGVQLHVGSGSTLKKSFSIACLPSSPSVYYATAASNPSSSVEEGGEKMGVGYLSDGLMGSRAQERKKGVPWTEDEHRRFLAGMEKLGRGDWRGISRRFVATRTPTQVASHAQKHFLRRSGLVQKKRRSSLFDVMPPISCSQAEPTTSQEAPDLELKLKMSTAGRQTTDQTSRSSPFFGTIRVT